MVTVEMQGCAIESDGSAWRWTVRVEGTLHEQCDTIEDSWCLSCLVDLSHVQVGARTRRVTSVVKVVMELQGGFATDAES